MRQLGGNLGLTPKPLLPQRRGELLVKDLDRDLPIVPTVVREIDGRHPAATDFRLDLVTC
jgi:hypothetical protein